jgi:hypothetical protein
MEEEQKECLHLEKEQMTVIKTTISSVNSTLQRINQKERIWKIFVSKILIVTQQTIVVEGYLLLSMSKLVSMIRVIAQLIVIVNYC